MKGRILVVFLLLVGLAAAQLGPGNVIRRMRVRVTFGSGGCDASTHVTLMGRNGAVADGGANDRCEVDFFNVPEGTYHLYVSGDSFANVDSDTVSMSSAGRMEFDVHVNRPRDVDHSYGLPGNAFVSTSDLGVPSRARKEFDKANELIG